MNRVQTEVLHFPDNQPPWAMACLYERNTWAFFQLREPTVIVGRAPGATIRVVSTPAALQHGTLTRTEEGVVFSDHSSTGTLVNRTQLLRQQCVVKIPATLVTGDVVKKTVDTAVITVFPGTIAVSNIYAVLQQAGDGGSAVVYRARPVTKVTQVTRDVAVKR